MDIDSQAIVARLESIRGKVRDAALAAGRPPDSVTLVAVSKTHPAAAIRAAYEAGQRDFGENYAQELARKRVELEDLAEIRWHFIGALQSNKAKLVVPGTALVHAIDRASVVEALQRRAEAAGIIAEVLVEVNVAGEHSKAGVAPEQVEELLSTAAALSSVRVRGLMCLPPVGEPEKVRPYFRRLRELRESLAGRHPSLDLLSMGMSGDFEVAIAEGSTHVRVGTAIFGERQKRVG